MAVPALRGNPQRWKLERLPNGDLEFSLRRLFLGRNIMPLVVRDQKGDESCLFQAFCSTGETDAYRQFAIDQVPSNNIQFKAYKFLDLYEADLGMSLAQERRWIVDLKGKMVEDRESRAVRIFREQGVPATSDHWEGEKQIKLENYQKLCEVEFETVADCILQGRCVAGSMPSNSHLRTLGPDEIYEFTYEAGTPLGTHMVVFTGFGIEADFSTGRPYLEFLDSSGTLFANGGFGKVYFESVYCRCMHVLAVRKMLPPAHMPPAPAANLGEDIEELEGDALLPVVFEAMHEVLGNEMDVEELEGDALLPVVFEAMHEVLGNEMDVEELEGDAILPVIFEAMNEVLDNEMDAKELEGDTLLSLVIEAMHEVLDNEMDVEELEGDALLPPVVEAMHEVLDNEMDVEELEGDALLPLVFEAMHEVLDNEMDVQELEGDELGMAAALEATDEVLDNDMDV